MLSDSKAIWPILAVCGNFLIPQHIIIFFFVSPQPFQFDVARTQRKSVDIPTRVRIKLCMFVNIYILKHYFYKTLCILLGFHFNFCFMPSAGHYLSFTNLKNLTLVITNYTIWWVFFFLIFFLEGTFTVSFVLVMSEQIGIRSEQISHLFVQMERWPFV